MAVSNAAEVRRDDKVNNFFLNIKEKYFHQHFKKKKIIQWPPPQFIAVIDPIKHSCRDKTGVSEEAIKEFSDGEIHDDPKLKCYMQCIFEKIDAVDENGDLHLEKIQLHFEGMDRETINILIHIGKKCLYQKVIHYAKKHFGIISAGRPKIQK